MLQGEFYSNNPCSVNERKESIQDAASTVSPAEFRLKQATCLLRLSHVFETKKTIPCTLPKLIEMRLTKPKHRLV
jgi:hypothetical protein